MTTLQKPVGGGKFASFDKDAPEAILNSRLHLRGGYVYLGNQRVHRLLLEAPEGMYIDHINGDPLDNRRCNLRVATPGQNTCNAKLRSSSTTKLIGVHYSQRDQNYQAQVMIAGARQSVGYYKDPILAAVARDRAAGEAHGEFVKLNYPEWHQEIADLPHPKQDKQAFLSQALVFLDVAQIKAPEEMQPPPEPTASNEVAYKGVTATGNRYMAWIRCHGKQRTLGRFLTPEAAAAAYNEAALEAFGDEAMLNVLP